MNYETFLQSCPIHVSRETFERLELYVKLLLRWQARVNLISASTIPTVWQRHIIDSLQFARQPIKGSIIDIGSGAGLPGLVLAIVGYRNIILVESDQRKSIFLQEAARQLVLPVTVINDRIEDINPLKVSFITARACAPLTQLLVWAERFMCKDTICLFAKGANYAMEVDEARRMWQFSLEIIPSITAPNAALLHISDLHRRAHATDHLGR